MIIMVKFSSHFVFMTVKVPDPIKLIVILIIYYNFMKLKSVDFYISTGFEHTNQKRCDNGG